MGSLLFIPSFQARIRELAGEAEAFVIICFLVLFVAILRLLIGIIVSCSLVHFREGLLCVEPVFVWLMMSFTRGSLRVQGHIYPNPKTPKP